MIWKSGSLWLNLELQKNDTHLDFLMRFKTNKKTFFSSIDAQIDIVYNQKIAYK